MELRELLNGKTEVKLTRDTWDEYDERYVTAKYEDGGWYLRTERNAPYCLDVTEAIANDWYEYLEDTEEMVNDDRLNNLDSGTKDNNLGEKLKDLFGIKPIMAETTEGKFYAMAVITTSVSDDKSVAINEWNGLVNAVTGEI